MFLSSLVNQVFNTKMIQLVLFFYLLNGICTTNSSTTSPQLQEDGEDSIKDNFIATSKFWGPIFSALLLFIVGVFVNFRKLIVNFSDGYRKTYEKRYDCHKIHSNWWSYLSFCGIGSSLRIFFSQFNSIWNICKKKNVKDRTVTVSSWSGIFKTCPKLSWKDVQEMMRSYDKYFLHHYNFCSYEECPHNDYKFCCGLMMEPVYYFVVVDWNSKNQGKYEIQNLTLEDNVALTVMDRDHRPPGYANLPNEQPNSELKKSLEDMKGQFKKICLVLLNFPTEISEKHAAIKAIHNFITDYNVKLIYKSWVKSLKNQVDFSKDDVNESLPLLASVQATYNTSVSNSESPKQLPDATDNTSVSNSESPKQLPDATDNTSVSKLESLKQLPDEHIRKCMIAYLTDKWFMENAVQANGLRQEFAYHLGLMDAKVGRIFGTTFRTENPILECVCSKAFENNCSTKDLLNSVNVAFKNVGLVYEIEENEINKSPFNSIDTSNSNIDFHTRKGRSTVFHTIADKSGYEGRYVLHFLVPYGTIQNYFLNKPNNVVERILATLEQWIITTKKDEVVWWRIQAVLTFLGRNDVIEAVINNFLSQKGANL
ncbi:uncharacterized protein LOC130633823 [Hydractinia symbiolongicarpus]|uniref:uncharacterized protein LOC130633823 n=1 Tax=Hydractinia symbiolongicarpus TaxID=13093 RepID=UPI00254C0535|nr:uncharacterized protein LOC130633823 [Hydractinia symbiolongicarpus]